MPGQCCYSLYMHRFGTLESCFVASPLRALRSAFVLELARLDGQREPILRWRQRTRPKVGEGTRRIEGLVEVDLDAIPLGQSGIRKPPGASWMASSRQVRPSRSNTMTPGEATSCVMPRIQALKVQPP